MNIIQLSISNGNELINLWVRLNIYVCIINVISVPFCGGDALTIGSKIFFLQMEEKNLVCKILVKKRRNDAFENIKFYL